MTLKFLPFSILAAYISTRIVLAQASLPNNLVKPSTSGSLSSLKYTNVGGSGSYNQVINMTPGSFPSCTLPKSQTCQTKVKNVQGNLAPFDEEMTMVFRAPMKISGVAVYQPQGGGGNVNADNWGLVSSWAKGQTPNNLVWMNNKGGGKSGEWDVCGGSSQSYANGAWNDAVSSPNQETYTGELTGTNEVNIVTGESCNNTSSKCDGFFRGTANHGWSGSKLYVVSFTMPPSLSPSNPSQPPAIWLLNSQITNAAQYGCNCRGVGSPGGCGELDILEVLNPGNANQGVSEMYSFKGATGSGNSGFFQRPTTDGEDMTLMVILDVKTDQIMIQKVTGWDFSGKKNVGRDEIDSYLGVQSLFVKFGNTGGGGIINVETSGSSASSRPASSAVESPAGVPIKNSESGSNASNVTSVVHPLPSPTVENTENSPNKASAATSIVPPPSAQASESATAIPTSTPRRCRSGGPSSSIIHSKRSAFSAHRRHASIRSQQF
ncbi:putative TOS1-like glycosyl hydrolase-domain-containing protein [Abortiporus biennis]|nr:putative TOS1-like glycosyl hydrolase-domain-containing protein [Abortiporus biennis]